MSMQDTTTEQRSTLGARPKPRFSVRIPRLRTFDSFAYTDYRYLWIGNFFANNAQWLQLLTVGWLVRGLTSGSSSSTLFVVTVGGMSLLPGLIMAPIAGTLGDRMDRRKLVIGIQAFMAAFSFLFAVMVGQQLVTVWHAYIYVFVSGVCVSISQNSRMALVANTVPRHAMAHAFATNVLTIPGTRMIGPFIGGILITTLGFFWNFTLESLLYLGTILVFLPIKTPYAQARRARANTSFLSDLIGGFTYVWKDKRVLLYLTMLGFIPNTILQPVMFLLPVFTDEILRRGADVGGYFLAINGLGGLLMALFIASFGFIFKKGNIVLWCALGSSIFILLFSYAIILPLAFLLIMLFASTQTAFRTTNGTLMQLLVSDDMRSRVTSLQRYSMGGVIISSFAIGWFARLTSVSIALLAMGIIATILAAAFYIFAKQIRELDA
ncbi:MAG: MFS transporter [Chloroflexi bacterium]|nr:MFS transporter [Chloroflexota bacterium]